MHNSHGRHVFALRGGEKCDDSLLWRALRRSVSHSVRLTWPRHRRPRGHQASGGTTIVVSPGQSIQAAVNRARPGDTVLVRAGVYQQSVQIRTDGITLRGSGNSLHGTVLMPPRHKAAQRCATSAFGPTGVCILAKKVDVKTGAVIQPVRGDTVTAPVRGRLPGQRRVRLRHRRPDGYPGRRGQRRRLRHLAVRVHARPCSPTTSRSATTRPASTSATRRTPPRSCATTSPRATRWGSSSGTPGASRSRATWPPGTARASWCSTTGSRAARATR